MLLLQRIVGVVLALALFVAAFFLASLLLAAAVVAGLGVWVWLWWRARKAPPPSGTIIEGEFRREPSAKLPERRDMPRDKPVE